MTRQERLNYLLETTKAQPFEYDLETSDFVIDQRHIPTDEILEPRYTPPEINLDTNVSGLMITDWNLVLQTPSMTQWLEGGNDGVQQSDFTQTIDVMAKAYAAQTGQKISKVLKGDNFRGFGVGLVRPGHATLSVLGDCACLGTTPHGMIFGEDEWRYGYAEYQPHNIDWPAQLTTLLVGAGTLAYLCRQAQTA